MRGLSLPGLALIVSVAASADASALCLEGRKPPLQDEFHASAVVAFGQVLAQRRVSSPADPAGYEETVYRFQPMRVFKGKAAQAFDLHSENSSSRFPMVPGRTYLVFAQSSRDGFYVDHCGHSTAAKGHARVVREAGALAGAELGKQLR